MRNVKAYWRVFLGASREDRANPRRMIAAVVQQVARVLLIVAIYRVAYAVGGHHALGFANAMWTIGICFAFFLSLGIRNIYLLVEYEIKAGIVETSLIKPLDWRLVKIIELLGKNALEFLVMAVVMPILLLITVGPPDVSHLTPLTTLLFVAFFFMSIFTNAGTFLMVGLAAFWLNDAKSVFRIVDKMGLLFCGTFVPFALLPGIIQQISYFLPFNIYAAPTRIFDPTITATLVPTIISGVAWMIIMFFACQFTWRKVNQRIEVNGG